MKPIPINGANSAAPAIAPVAREALRPRAAAKFLGCGRATLYRLIERGEIQPRKIGRATIIMTEDLRALLSRAAVPGAVVARGQGSVS